MAQRVKVPAVQALSLDPQDPQKSPHGHGPHLTSPSLKCHKEAPEQASCSDISKPVYH